MAFYSRKSILLLLVRFAPLVQSAPFVRNMSKPSQTFLQTHVTPKSVKTDPYNALTASHTGLHQEYISQTKVKRNRSLPKIVSKAYYINLAQDFARRKSMEAQLIKLQEVTGLPYERFNAINTRTDKWVQTKRQNASEFTKWDALIGCYASHMRLWKQMLVNLNQSLLLSTESSPEYALVFEDDALVHPHAMDMLDIQLASAPNDVDILLLDFWGGKRQEDKVGERLYRAMGPFATSLHKYHQYYYGGMHAYLIKLARLPTLIKHLEDEKNCLFPETDYIELSPDVCTTFNALTCRKYALFPSMLGTKEELEDRGGRKAIESDSDEDAKYEGDTKKQ